MAFWWIDFRQCLVFEELLFHWWRHTWQENHNGFQWMERYPKTLNWTGECLRVLALAPYCLLFILVNCLKSLNCIFLMPTTPRFTSPSVRTKVEGMEGNSDGIHKWSRFWHCLITKYHNIKEASLSPLYKNHWCKTKLHTSCTSYQPPKQFAMVSKSTCPLSLSLSLSLSLFPLSFPPTYHTWTGVR